MISELSNRYAEAIYDLAKETNAETAIQDELRVLKESIEKDSSTEQWFLSVNSDMNQREELIKVAFEQTGFSQSIVSLVRLLAKKNRLYLVSKIADSYRDLLDRENGVCRGVVKSSITLDSDERQRIETIVEKKLN